MSRAQFDSGTATFIIVQGAIAYGLLVLVAFKMPNFFEVSDGPLTRYRRRFSVGALVFIVILCAALIFAFAFDN